MQRVWVTRDEGPDGPLSTALRKAGVEPVPEPVLTRRIVLDIAPYLKRLGPRDWLVLTSPYAIEHVPVELVRCRVAVVGAPSQSLAESRGLRVDLVSSQATGESLWRELSERLDGTRCIVFPRSSLAPLPVLAGVETEAPVFYETVPRPYDPAVARRVAAAAVGSPSAARIVAALPACPPCASIGPTTSAALRAAGITPWIESPEANLQSLAQTIAAALEGCRGAAP